jgi:hypothetical protein
MKRISLLVPAAGRVLGPRIAGAARMPSGEAERHGPRPARRRAGAAVRLSGFSPGTGVHAVAR